ncbi:ATP-binding cassette domain-containing protein [Streptomyces sp. MST-110588]|uniref:ATP-binding cassette domain-containing protein n=1 Tax=Streptomyces sp. MST-110588 TaxID=2833628 RepID=UPI001F5CDA3C|nr:ATP-binding cassette domain-containing protein [Streptomyces sp. MST-110588]UNO42345.1 ATP-binding cassette domain-containing protein [Streptomyces sp. MST-110588]
MTGGRAAREVTDGTRERASARTAVPAAPVPDVPDATEAPPRPRPPVRLRSAGVRFLLRRRRVLARLAAWSVVETGQTFVLGYALARALDDGFLRGAPGVGAAWLAAAAVSVVAGAYGTGRVYRAVAGLVEPLRDVLVRRVVERGLRAADGAAVSRLTHQVEIARDTSAGLVLVSRSFVFVAAGALAGLLSLAPVLLLVVLPPLVLGVALFLATLGPMARRQETFLAADEAISRETEGLIGGLRDITAGGAERWAARTAGERFDAELRAARSLARWSVWRVLALAVSGHLPLVLLLVTAPWLLERGVTAGALVGALAYLSQSLLPALHSLMHGLGTSGTRLGVVLRRLLAADSPTDVRTSAGMYGDTGPTSSRTSDPTTSRTSDPASGPASHPASGPAPASAPAPAPAPGVAVELRNVSFAYGPHAEPVVRDLDLILPAGAHLAVVGPSGIGKSTLAALMAGLLPPGRGEIRTAFPGPRARVLLPQEAYVFSGTVRENLLYLCPDTWGSPPQTDAGTDTDADTDADTGAGADAGLWAAAEAVGADRLMERLGGPAARVVPAELSAGERQLIALARAYLAPARLAILDEATCHLDPAAEARAEHAFAGRPGGTLVVIAHRVSSALRAKEVLIMDGTHALHGRHDELLRRSPLYRDLAGNWAAGGALPHARRA